MQRATHPDDATDHLAIGFLALTCLLAVLLGGQPVAAQEGGAQEEPIRLPLPIDLPAEASRSQDSWWHWSSWLDLLAGEPKTVLAATAPIVEPAAAPEGRGHQRALLERGSHPSPEPSPAVGPVPGLAPDEVSLISPVKGPVSPSLEDAVEAASAGKTVDRWGQRFPSEHARGVLRTVRQPPTAPAGGTRRRAVAQQSGNWWAEDLVEDDEEDAPQLVDELPGGTEAMEIHFVSETPAGQVSTFVRGQQQEEDASAHAFGRFFEGAAGLQYTPDGVWSYRVELAQEFLNQLDVPMRGMNVSLQMQVRF